VAILAIPHIIVIIIGARLLHNGGAGSLSQKFSALFVFRLCRLGKTAASILALIGIIDNKILRHNVGGDVAGEAVDPLGHICRAADTRIARAAGGTGALAQAPCGWQ